MDQHLVIIYCLCQCMHPKVSFAIAHRSIAYALSDETSDQLRSALLPFFTKSAPDDADSEK